MKKRGLSILLVLCMVLALLPVMSTPAQAAVIGDDYPANLKAYNKDAIVDDWGFLNRECTSFAAWRLNNTNGVAFNNSYAGVSWGDASNWGYAAQNAGITVDMNPTVGSIAWISGSHVAWVAEVNGDSVTVEEYNWEGDGLYHTYTWPKSHYTGFIHIKDLGFNKNNNTLSRDYGNVFYAYILTINPWLHLTAVGGENGSNVALASSNTGTPQQIWRFEQLSDGAYIITNEYSGRSLEVGGSADWDNANVSIWDYLGSWGQKWYLSLNTETNPNSYIFTPGHCNLVMACAGDPPVGGANIQIHTRNGSASQNFGVYVLANDGVVYSKPSKPAASSVTTTEAVAGTAANISWTNSALVNQWDARTYTLTLKDSSGNTVLSKSDLTDTSYSFTFPSAGTYTAQVTAVNTMYYDYKTVGSAKTITVSTPDPINPFTDVPKGKFYHDPVLWAISQNPQITTGVTKTTFEPDRICTRAHVVTFLWRANGCPEPTNLNSNFKDVKDTNKYYYKAVLWAAENGITTGYSDGTFRPDDECTRGQVVTFLWRAKGQPTPSSGSIPFTDVPAGKYYTTAVLWALENNITQGRTATTFGPDDACTRGHVVTFLYRAYA